MLGRMNSFVIVGTVVVVVLAAGLLTPAQAQELLREDFNTVSGSGGGVFLIGGGTADTNNWEDNISGEKAFAGTVWNARVQASAQGVPGAGVDGTGAGQISVQNVTFDLLNETFEMANGIGGTQFLTGDGVTPDLQSWTPGYDDGLQFESAFAGAQDGAIIADTQGATAQALLGGGYSGAGAEISINGVTVGPGSLYAGLSWRVNYFPGARPLLDPGFDEDGGTMLDWDWDTLVGWNIYASAEMVRTGTFSAKLFGEQNVAETGETSISGISQAIEAAPDEEWHARAYVGHLLDFPLLGANTLDMKIEFYDAGGTLLPGGAELEVLNAASPSDTFILQTLSATAPAVTAEARLRFVFTQENDTHEGAAFIDDVGFKAIGATNVNLADFTLSADIKGTANAGAGETLGDYQLRLEDTDGNRLIFEGQTNGSWQTNRGGTLDTALQADENGDPAPGAFNINSAFYTVVAAIYDEGPNRWGTGGTLAVDNLLLPSSDSTGSDWYAGLFWDDIVANISALDTFELTAMIKGNVPDGAYELRLECNKLIDAGIAEDFEATNGAGSGWFLCDEDWDQITPQTEGYQRTTAWAQDINGIGAYGGLYNGMLWDIFPGQCDAGFWAGAAMFSGYTGNGGEIRAANMSWGVGGGWYAGLDFREQGLASQDLSLVLLEAWVKGLPWTGGGRGPIELRIQDAQGDRRYFRVDARDVPVGEWQYIGGTLDNATEAGPPGGGGGGDGFFNLDSPTYTVAIAFADETEAGSWQWGGRLIVDDVYLTPAQIPVEIGAVRFAGVADGDFQSVGGLLSEGTAKFGDIAEDFGTATGEGGGEWFNSCCFAEPPECGTGNCTNVGWGVVGGGWEWDFNIQDESCFAGYANPGTLGEVWCQACTNCGVGDSGAAQLRVVDALPQWETGTNGSWWTGIDFPDLPIDLSAGKNPGEEGCTDDCLAGLADVFFEAQVKLEAPQGQPIGRYVLRLEEDPPGGDVLSFHIEPSPNGQWQQVGGSLADAVQEKACPTCGDGFFNYNQFSYSAVLIVFAGEQDDTVHWGNDITLTLDDMFLTGIGIDEAQSFTVALTFEDPLATWGTDASLTVDNLRLISSGLGDLNCDGVVDGLDVDPFIKVLTASPPYDEYYAAHPGCFHTRADIDADQDFDVSDVGLFADLLLTGG